MNLLHAAIGAALAYALVLDAKVDGALVLSRLDDAAKLERTAANLEWAVGLPRKDWRRPVRMHLSLRQRLADARDRWLLGKAFRKTWPPRETFPLDEEDLALLREGPEAPYREDPLGPAVDRSECDPGEPRRRERVTFRRGKRVR